MSNPQEGTMRAKIAVLAIAAAAIAMMAAPASAVELTGYWRSGIAGSSNGGNQVCFAAPGYTLGGAGPGKWRLGNECETYGEFELYQTVFKDKSGVQFDFHQMLAFQTGNLAQGGTAPAGYQPGFEWAMRQLWIEAKNIPSLGGASLWIGQRYYRRHNVDPIDWFYWDAEGSGAGIENIDLGFAKLAFATFESVQSRGNVAWRPDLQLYGIGVNPNGTLELGVEGTFITNPAANVESGSAFVVAEHTQANLLGGSNRLALQYGWGPSWVFNGYNGPDFSGTSDDKQFRIVEQFQFQASPEFSGLFDVTFQKMWRNTAAVGGTRLTVEIRPVIHFSDYFKLQADFGIGTAKAEGGSDSATLWKLTVAPTVVAGRGYWARPELRLFVTYASWNDLALAEGVAGGAFGTKKNGMTAGAQLEAWF
jgi:maltoporin